MTYKLSLGLQREEIIRDLKRVRKCIIDDDSYQKADTGIILSNLDDIIDMCEEAKDIPAVAPVKHGGKQIKDLYERYVDACAMCTTLECEECTLRIIIEDLAEILGIKE